MAFVLRQVGEQVGVAVLRRRLLAEDRVGQRARSEEQNDQFGFEGRE